MISKLVYGLGFPLLRQQSSVYLVEGVFDVFHCWPRAVGTFGKHLSQAQVNVLRTVGVQEVYLLWDAESWQTTPDLWDHAVKKLSSYFLTVPVQLPHSTPTEYSMAALDTLREAAYGL
jgi:hypothetical protein